MENEAKITVLIVDDHPMMRVGIAAIVNARKDMLTVGQAGTGEQAVELFEKHQPDITLMDLRLPGMSGVEAIRQIHNSSPEACIVVLTTYEGDEDIYQALEAGARAYVIKSMPHEVLINALRRAHSGRQYLPAPVLQALTARQPGTRLSSRERDVLSLLVGGKSNKQIAVDLGITEATVKSHVSTILLRLQVDDRTQAVIAALRRGLEHL